MLTRLMEPSTARLLITANPAGLVMAMLLPLVTIWLNNWNLSPPDSAGPRFDIIRLLPVLAMAPPPATNPTVTTVLGGLSDLLSDTYVVPARVNRLETVNPPT